MTALSVTNPQVCFTDIMGRPLAYGKLYVGSPGGDAKTTYRSVSLYKDSGLSQTINQPVTIKSGYPVDTDDNDTLVNLYVDNLSYSIRVEDRNNDVVFSSTSKWERNNIRFGSKVEEVTSTARTVRTNDLGKLFKCSENTTIDSETAQVLGNGFLFGVKNAGTNKTVTLSLSGGIDGTATHTLSDMESAIIGCSGSGFNFYGKSSGGPSGSGSEYNFLDHNGDFSISDKPGLAASARRYTLKIPPTNALINGTMIKSSDVVHLSLNELDNWLPGEKSRKLHTAANRKGEDIYLYMSNSTNAERRFKFSAVKDQTDYGSGTVKVRRIAIFHCLCDSVGSIAGHDLSGYVTGDILPKSIQWVYNHPRTNEPEGFCLFSHSTWASIYTLSWNNNDVEIKNNTLPLLSGPSDSSRTTKQLCEVAGLITRKGWRCMDRMEFLTMFEGTPANPGRMNPANKTAALAVKTGSNSITVGGSDRIISNHGIEDVSGAWPQISKDELLYLKRDMVYTGDLKGKSLDTFFYLAYGASMTINDTTNINNSGPNSTATYSWKDWVGNEDRTGGKGAYPETNGRWPYAYRAICDGVRRGWN